MKKNSLFSILIFSTLLFTVISCTGGDKYKNGERLYKLHCANCHGDNGGGVGKRLIPPLKDSDYLRKHAKDIICIINNGLNDSITVNGVVYDQAMAGIPNLSAVELTNLVNYINERWPFQSDYMKLSEVEAAFEGCK